MMDLTQLTFKWETEVETTEELTRLFIENSTENYISHSEIQEGRALDETTWASDIHERLSLEFSEAIQNMQFHQSNIAAAYYTNQIVGFALVEYETAPSGDYAILSDIVVDYNYRKNKVGEGLLQWIVTQLRPKGFTSIFAESNIKNHPAHHFMEQNGFHPISKVFRLDL